MIPLFKVAMNDQAEKAVGEVLRSGYIGEGEKVRAFTARCANELQNQYVVPTNSCTAALTMALKLAGIGPGKTVISTPMTCLATNLAIIDLGADIVWADVEPDTGNVAVESVRRILKTAGFVDAIMCVHWAGYPCDMDALHRLAWNAGILVIEDAAHAWGSTINGYPVGNSSDMACFSFQAIKHLTTGDGGLLSCTDRYRYGQARLMKWFGLDRDLSPDMRCNQDPPVLGLKYHMNDVAAAIGLANFDMAKANVLCAQRTAQEYYEAFKGLSRVGIPVYDPDRASSFWLCPIFVSNPTDFCAYMRNKGISVSQVHARNDKKQLFMQFSTDLPGVDAFCSKQTNIPAGWWLSEDDKDKIIDAVRSY